MTTRTPFSANLRFRNAAGNILQRLTRVNPGLDREGLNDLMRMVNGIRRTDQSVTGGYYTVKDELRRA